MPLTRTATELQRNMGEVSKLCHETKKPVYVTTNGNADLVLIDASAFEKMTDLRDAAYGREMRTLEGIERGRAEFDQGQSRTWGEIKQELGL